MATFDLSILSILENKFNELKQEIDEKNELIKIKDEEMQKIIKQIQDLESKKLNLEMDLGENKKEKLRLEEIYNSTTTQCSQIQESASKILTQF